MKTNALLNNNKQWRNGQICAQRNSKKALNNMSEYKAELLDMWYRYRSHFWDLTTAITGKRVFY